MSFDWNSDFAWQIMPRLLAATGNTLMAALIGYAIAMVLGLVFAILLRNGWPPLAWLLREVIEFLRSTPLVLQIFFVFYVGPQFGLKLSPWVAGMAAIGLHYSAYLCEVYRAAILSVPKGQWEACRALNLTGRDTYCRIILPEALPAAVPGMGNYLVGILKDTPMLSVIGVAELMHAATSIGSETYRYLEPITLVGIIFLALSLPIAGMVRLIEYRLRRKFGI